VRFVLALLLLSASVVRADPTCGTTKSFTGVIDKNGDRVPDQASAAPAVLCVTISKTEISFSITKKDANGVTQIVRSPNMLRKNSVEKQPDGFTVRLVDDMGYGWMIDVGKTKEGEKYFSGVRSNVLDQTYLAALTIEPKTKTPAP
jgi:hypothetical protein